MPEMADELDSSVFNDLQFVEGHTFLQVTIHVTSIDPPSRRYPHRKPIIHFGGSTTGGGGVETQIQGMVRDEGGDVIRWTVSSIAGGEMKLRTEGVQIGGVQSAAGWVGCWITSTRGPFDAAGPSWAYKIG